LDLSVYSACITITKQEEALSDPINKLIGFGLNSESKNIKSEFGEPQEWKQN